MTKKCIVDQFQLYLCHQSILKEAFMTIATFAGISYFYFFSYRWLVDSQNSENWWKRLWGVPVVQLCWRLALHQMITSQILTHQLEVRLPTKPYSALTMDLMSLCISYVRLRKENLAFSLPKQGRWSCVKASHIFYICASTHAWPVMPKVSTQVYMLDCKIWKLFRPRGNRQRKKQNKKKTTHTQNVISSPVQHLISLIFAIHVSFIIPLPMMWILLTKLMQKSVTTVCLHCS